MLTLSSMFDKCERWPDIYSTVSLLFILRQTHKHTHTHLFRWSSKSFETCIIFTDYVRIYPCACLSACAYTFAYYTLLMMLVLVFAMWYIFRWLVHHYQIEVSTHDSLFSFFLSHFDTINTTGRWKTRKTLLVSLSYNRFFFSFDTNS